MLKIIVFVVTIVFATIYDVDTGQQKQEEADMEHTKKWDWG